MKIKYDDLSQHNCVVVDGGESCEQVADACADNGAVHPEDDQLYVQFPGGEPEYVTRSELRKRLLEGRNF